MYSETINKTDYPLVSVLIPTYNYGHFIAQAIDSVLAQDYDNLEIIVVDDGSTDDTANVVQRIVETDNYPSLRNGVRYFHKTHSGISASRNFALKQAQGEFIGWIDADDIWEKGKLTAQMEYFRLHPDCLIVFTRFTNFYENEELTTNTLAQHEEKIADSAKHYLPSSLARKTLYERCGNFKTELVIGEDVDMLFRFKFLFPDIDMNNLLDSVYYLRRLHGDNITFRERPLIGNTFVNKLLFPNLKSKIMETMKL
ncbi:MAG: glycosyltransferase family 2 protein [Paludibacter sp.]|jgi:glycosyltransferase involved in cell wall biosynthesis|nr:glycosyltransferase family 2 protein [Paludibacter sp.]